jgi:hypothetical protein
MTLVTIRPDSTVINTSTLTGGATAHAVLSDNSDASYCATASSQDVIECGFGNPSIPAGAVISYAQFRLRFSSTTNQQFKNMTLKDPSTFNLTGFTATSSSPGTYTIIPSWAKSFTSTQINAIAAHLEIVWGASGKLYEIYLDVAYVAKPVVAVSAPTGTITDTNLPTITWTDTLDSGGSVQTAYQVRIFNSTQYGAGGFDPSTSTATLDSGALSGTNLSWTASSVLVDATYRAYVRVGQTVNGVTFWSDYAFTGWVQTVSLPGVPTLVATAESGKARNGIVLTNVNGTVGADRFELQRFVGYRNMMVNPSAEDGSGGIGVTIAGGSGNETLSVAAYADPTAFGNYGDWIYRAAKINSTVGAWGMFMNNAGTGGVGNIKPGRTYAAVAKMTQASPTNLQARCTIEFNNAGGNITSALGSIVYPGGVSVAIGVAPAGADRTNVSFYCVTNGVSPNFYDADGFVLMEVPAGTQVADVLAIGYFDGTMATAEWEGNANASASLTGTVGWEELRTADGDGLLKVPYVTAVSTYTDSADGTAHTIPLPTPTDGIQANDILLGVAGMDGNPTFTWPTDWTEIRDVAGNASAVRSGVAWKRCTGGESGTITLTTGASEGGAVQVHCIRDADRTTAPEVSTGVNGSSTAPDPDNYTPSRWFNELTLWFAAAVYDNGSGTLAATTFFNMFDGLDTKWANVNGAGVVTGNLLSQVSSLNPVAGTLNAIEDWSAFTIAVRPMVRADALVTTLFDYEAPNGAVVHYRARALHEYNGTFAATAWSTVTTSVWQSNSWWLKCPTKPSLNSFVTVRSLLEEDRAGRSAVFQALGATRPIVVQDTRGSKTGQVTFLCLTTLAQDALDELIDSAQPLLLQGPAGKRDPGYIIITGMTRTRAADWDRPVPSYDTCDYVQVDEPFGVLT